MPSSRMALSAGLALTLVPLSIGLTLPTKRDLTVFTLDGWTSLGCWSDSQSSRTLSLMAHSGEHCSDDNCQYQCTQLGYNYAGTEYSGQCYCGNNVNSKATQKPDGDCDMACTGKPDQPCGGPDRMNLFWNGKTTTPPPATVTNPGVDNWVSEGCYTDSVAARTLGHKVDTTGGGSKMTVQLCVDACQNAGYSLAGAEYGGECYCDNAYNNGGLASDQTTCSMTCNGNATEYCGGPGTMNLYSLNGATPVASAPTPSTSATSVQPAVPSNWASLGCYTDTNGKRALSHPFNSPSGGMTVEICIGLCSNAGYIIAGVEYGQECYCDSLVRNNQGLAANGDAGCNMKCSGNAGETCGGADRLNMYAAGPGWVKLGCYSDQPYKRTLAYTATIAGGLTIDKCQASCKAAGYSYAGVEYGNECHCGSSFDNGGGPASDGNAGCSFQCEGDNSQICGGSQRLSMYEYIQADGTVSHAAPAASSTPTDAASAAGNSKPTPATTGLTAGWSYIGPYVDNAQGRILATQQPDSNTLTAASCVSACAGGGYSIAGLEYGKQCFCGNAIQNGGVAASTSAAQSKRMACSGDATQACGGPDLIEIYSTSTPTTASAPAVQTDNLPGTWAWGGCVSDDVGHRTLPVGKTFDSTNSATQCLNYCSGLGYNYAGVEYSRECYCGSTADFQASGATQSSQCTMTCSGAPSFLCGGAGAMDYYVAS